MKFRGCMSHYAAMKDFMNLVHSFSKLSKECVLRILPEKLYFIILDDDSGPKRPYVWCELQIQYYFKEYHMDGVSTEFNEIYLSFSSVLFAKSVTPVRQGAKSLKMKLTNKQSPCITLEFEMAITDSEQTRTCVHDIPVEIVTRSQWNDYAEPKLNNFHVTMQLPAIKSVQNIVERMKTMSQYLIVSAEKTGKITLKIETTLVTLSAHFTNLLVHSFAENINCNEDSEATIVNSAERLDGDLVSASIDIRKFVNFLQAMQFGDNKVVCSIVNDRMVKLLVENLESVTVKCFLTQCTS